MSLKYDGFNGTVTAQPKSRAFVDFSFSYALLAVVIVCVGARILVKTKLRILGREDVLILISTVRYPMEPFDAFISIREPGSNVTMQSLILQLLVLTTVGMSKISSPRMPYPILRNVQ